jgi:hypothetical protein
MTPLKNNIGLLVYGTRPWRAVSMLLLDGP